MSSPTKTALALVFDGVEEVEVLTPVDLLRRAGIATTMASLTERSLISGRNGIRFEADCLLEAVDPATFDALILPGGPGVLELVDDKLVGELLQGFAANRRLVAAICAAPKVLAANGLLNQIEATSHASVRADLPRASNKAVVVSGRFITSQGVGTAIDFSLAIIKELLNPKAARDVANAIHAWPRGL